MKLEISNLAWNDGQQKKVYSLIHKYGHHSLEVTDSMLFEFFMAMVIGIVSAD